MNGDEIVGKWQTSERIAAGTFAKLRAVCGQSLSDEATNDHRLPNIVAADHQHAQLPTEPGEPESQTAGSGFLYAAAWNTDTTL